MSWDPITRIVGSLGIHTEIDFTNQKVNKCYSTSMIFRGFDIFMKGIDPRDAHFITSRICGICGDNHCTCSCLNQNMAYAVKPPKLGDLAFNLAETADYMFDHAIFNDCMANVDFCEQMVKETNPALLAKAETTAAPHRDIHGFRMIADIMRALNPFTGAFYLETLHVARYTREMYCLFGGRHTHPSTIMPGGCSADITHQTCTDYYVRLMRYFDYVKRSVPMHDDLYDFFLQELPGYDMVGYRDTNLVNWGSFDDPDYVDYDYRTMTNWGRKRYVTPGVAINGELVSTDLVEINLMIRILLGSSYFDGWENEPTFVTHDPLGNAVDKNHPWNKVTLPRPQKRDFADKYTWVVSPRIYDKRTGTHVCCDTGGGPFARQWCTAKAGLVDFGFCQSDRPLDPDGAAAFPEHARDGARVDGAGEVQRDRARSRPLLPPGLQRGRRPAQPPARDDGGAGRPDEELEQVHGARDSRQRRLPRGRARSALASHGDPRGQDRQLPAVPADAVEREPARCQRNPGALRGCRAEHADLRGERPGELQGHRHHARCALLRPVPAVRCAHVHRRREGPQGDAHADGPVLAAMMRAHTGAPDERTAPDERHTVADESTAPDERHTVADESTAPADTSAQLFGRVQELQERLDRAPDAATRALAQELLGAVVGLYGEGLERIVSRLQAAGEGGARLDAGLADDPLLATLLLIHDLHPVPLVERVQAALDSVRPYMESHGGDVQLLSIRDGVARIHLRGSCSDCSASSVTLELAIKQALEEAAPDLDGLEVEGLRAQASDPSGTALPMASPAPAGAGLPVVMAGAPGWSEPAWIELESVAALGEGQLAAVSPAGRELVVANVDGSLLAYHDECAACGSPLRGGRLSAGALACPACGSAFLLPRAGRSIDAQRLQLTPVPLLREGASVKVAVAL